MKLQLVPIAGEKKIVSEEEKARLRKRTEPIAPERLRAFAPAEQKAIKHFLASLVTLTEQVHHLMGQGHVSGAPDETEMQHLQSLRAELFHKPPPVVAGFIRLLDFFPMEPWHEFEMMIAGVRGDDIHHYYVTKLKAAVDTHHVRVEDQLEAQEEQKMLSEVKLRITPSEINDLIHLHPLEDLVRHLIDARRLISGEFWDEGYYDF
ncbi:MAG: hypothetical protein A3I78_00750 [Gammaproteobacteria bacterium RIFCSPLOWO2_02_FULL_56_15]|nr:MAG: hypothetical protein A3I78_00750 [Gammaproteobacteria bacterium RIFCSPLOWO2_02_FULL_56_15]